MIKSVQPGTTETTFQFVAATLSNVEKGDKIPSLTFFKTKAVSYPGGDKFQPLDICEIDPRAGLYYLNNFSSILYYIYQY